LMDECCSMVIIAALMRGPPSPQRRHHLRGQLDLFSHQNPREVTDRGVGIAGAQR